MTLYKGNFCWHGEDHILYTYANTTSQAFFFFCKQLAKKLEYNSSAVANYFRGTDKYTIKKEEKETNHETPLPPL